MMADKNSLCPTDGLNQKFKIAKDENDRKRVVISQALSEADLSKPILGRINVDACCDRIYNDEFGPDAINFADYLNYLADRGKSGEKISSLPSAGCAGCEFKTTDKEAVAGLKSGFRECWKESLKRTD